MFDKYIRNTFHRNLLEKLLKEHKKIIKGKILDVGSRNRRYDHLFEGEVTAVDIIPNKELNILFGDIEKGLRFPDNYFDSIICIDVFEYLENYENAIKEIYRLLNPKGTAIITVPFMCYDHDDKIRFTKKFILSKLTKFSNVDCLLFGNGFVVIWDILFRKIMKIKKITIRKLLLTLILPYIILLKLFKLENIIDEDYIGLFIILKK